MNKGTGVFIGAAVFVLVASGVYVSMSNRNDAMMEKKKMNQQVTDDVKMPEKKMMVENNATEVKEPMKKEADVQVDSVVKKGDMGAGDDGTVMKKMGSYEAYRADKMARAETGDVVLFFHASWCPSCRGLSSSIENNLSSIPERVTILKVNYDQETELKKKYGVTYQHTLVQVDKDGNMMKKWSGSSSLENLLSQIQ